MTFDGLKFLITGGSAGIGRQLALDLAAQGAQVLACGRNPQRLKALEADQPAIRTAVCDVRNYDSVVALRDTALERLGSPDVLINNAAIFRRIDLMDSTHDVGFWLDEVDINVMGALRVTHALLPSLMAGGDATIINLTSGLAYAPMAAAPVYSATKAALHSWTRSLRHQLRNTGVSVIEVAPPVVDTQMNVNNPGAEGRRKWSTKAFSELVLRRFGHSRRKDILVGDSLLANRMSRLAPGFLFRQINGS